MHGTPAGVLIAATEDAVQYVIVPRLIAADADLDRIHFVSVEADGHEGCLKLPEDGKDDAFFNQARDRYYDKTHQ